MVYKYQDVFLEYFLKIYKNNWMPGINCNIPLEKKNDQNTQKLINSKFFIKNKKWKSRKKIQWKSERGGTWGCLQRKGKGNLFGSVAGTLSRTTFDNTPSLFFYFVLFGTVLIPKLITLFDDTFQERERERQVCIFFGHSL